MFSVTCVAPVNIALIKYWGKRDEDLILPINDSVSMTLSTDDLCAKTTISTSCDLEKNSMELNGVSVPFEDNERIMRCLSEVRILAERKPGKIPLSWKIKITSFNNFPTAAGLASSAAGYACLVYCLAVLYDLPINEELTAAARQGSGSACRSLYGGFVQWHRGERLSGTDSVARQIVPAEHWPNMHVLILVVNDERKKTASTQGMQLAMTTSSLIAHRANVIVPNRVEKLKNAIKRRDFATFAELTMRDSNQFHAIAMDTFPPCVYMNDTSHWIVSFVHGYNDRMGEPQAAYTFDAGPNACLYVLEENVPGLVRALQKVFPNDLQDSKEYLRGIPVPKMDEESEIKTTIDHMEAQPRNALKYIIHTKVGTGPQQLATEIPK
ncbi:hypothetical protein KR018_011475 [Drosophila ironensis]|nr:hypothetical protein KR018_011475 [Drosophila ironensis]